jgi:Cof subfamily protein (haloacid dehalogenase superfamily)
MSERALKLFATDLDGTLLGPDDSIHPSDLEAIRVARERGVVFTIATGRLTSRTHDVARRLGLDAPLVCADGGVLACSTTERILARRAVDRELAVALLEHFAGGSLASFVFTADAIHACQTGSRHHRFVQGWAPRITTHQDLRIGAFREQNDAIMLLGIGAGDSVHEVANTLKAYAAWVDAFTFELGGRQVLRLIAKGTSKGAALSELAVQLGVARENTAVAGDWYNDISMFEFAGRSFAMPGAPFDVRAKASDVLEAGVEQRGPIAEALQRWLAEAG